jgi:outer membrane receptor for ferrienterochelin and colicin
VFVQDNWKITRNLRLDCGVRRDWAQVPHEIHNTFIQFAPTVHHLSRRSAS